jgi:WD40 repeat protein
MIVLSDANQIRIYAIQYEPVKISILQKIEMGGYSSQFSPSGQLIVGGFDGSVHIVDLTSWECLTYKHHTSAVIRVGVSSCGKYILSGDSTKRIVCYNVSEKKVFLTNLDSRYATHFYFSSYKLFVSSVRVYRNNHDRFKQCVPNSVGNSHIDFLVK